jgi:putative transposase
MQTPRNQFIAVLSWKSRFVGMRVPEAGWLKQLEEENARLKRLVADQTLHRPILKDRCERLC